MKIENLKPKKDFVPIQILITIEEENEMELIKAEIIERVADNNSLDDFSYIDEILQSILRKL